VLKTTPDDEVALQAHKLITKVIGGTPLEDALNDVDILEMLRSEDSNHMLPRSW
jgi:hypothetical protein